MRGNNNNNMGSFLLTLYIYDVIPASQHPCKGGSITSALWRREIRKQRFTALTSLPTSLKHKR